jgi:hypothetical protein
MALNCKNMMRLIITAFFLLGVQTMYAQQTKQNSISIGFTTSYFFDGQWAIKPSVNTRSNGLGIPMTTYRRLINNGGVLTVKIYQAKRYGPDSYLRRMTPPYVIERNARLLQFTFGKSISLLNLNCSFHSGIGIQTQTKVVFLYKALTSAGWWEGVVASGRKLSAALPLEMSIQKNLWRNFFTELSANYVFSLSDYEYYLVSWDVPERHMLTCSLTLGYRFGR